MRLVVIGVIAALLVPALAFASASFMPEEPYTVTTGTARVGDALRYAEWWQEGDGEPSNSTTTLLLEGPSGASDRFGVDRETEATLVQVDAKDFPATLRCHSIPGGVDAVRIDTLQGGEANASMHIPSSILGIPVFSWTGEVMIRFGSGFGGMCPDRALLQATTHAEGAEPTSVELVGPGFNVTFATDGAPSEPAGRTEFLGRRALEFRYPYDDGTPFVKVNGSLTITLADGIPGIARLSFEGTFEEFCPDDLDGCSDPEPQGPPERLVWGQELVGWIATDGEPLTPLTGAELPEENPNLKLEPYFPLHLDDAGLPFAYPYGEAFDAVYSDPSTGFAVWLARHPDAFLLSADYTTEEWIDAPMNPDSQVPYEGKWSLTFVAKSGFFMVTSTRYSEATTPAGPVPIPVKPVKNSVEPAWVMADVMGMNAAMGREDYAPPQIPSFASVLPVIEKEAGEGAVVAEASITRWYDEDGTPLQSHSLGFKGGSGTPAANESSVEHVIIDPESMGVLFIYTAGLKVQFHAAPGVLPPPDAPRWREGLVAQAALPPIPPGLGFALGAAAVGAAALVALAVKFLVLPFYTRLRRDRLLENPVRARMYECIRANPGIHRAELIDFMGIGDGGTRHHLDKLVEARLVVTLPVEGFVRYYVAGELPPALAEREAVLRAGSNRRVYELLAAEPNLSLREAAARLGMSAPSVHKCVQRLRAAGLLAHPRSDEAPAQRAKT